MKISIAYINVAGKILNVDNLLNYLRNRNISDDNLRLKHKRPKFPIIH